MVDRVKIKKTALFWIAGPHKQLSQLLAKVLNNFGFINHPKLYLFGFSFTHKIISLGLEQTLSYNIHTAR